MIGDIIKELRVSHNISQAKLGNLMGVTQQAVARWENGHSEPDSTTLKKMSDLFGVSIDYILDNEKLREPVSPNKSNEFLDAGEQIPPKNTIISIGRGGERKVYEISDEDADLVNAFIKKMAKKNR